MKLIYWDIDGTLVDTGMAGMHAIHEVFHALQGHDRVVPRPVSYTHLTLPTIA